MPEFSIITTTYNRAHLIIKAIESVLTQTFTDFEYIIVNDGSSDNTAEIIQSFTDPRIKYFLIANSERGFARNYGIKKSSGKYISILDSDDYYLPNQLQSAYDFILKKRNPAFFFQGNQTVDINGKFIYSVNFPKDRIIENLCQNNVACPMGGFIRSDVMHENLFDEDYNFKIAEDLYVWLKIGAKHGIQFNNSITGSCVNHMNNTMNTLNPHLVLYCRDKLITLLNKEDSFKSKYGKHLKSLFNNQTNLAIYAFTVCGDYEKSLKMTLELIFKSPKELLRKRTFVIFRNITYNILEKFKKKIWDYLHEDIWSVAISDFTLERLNDSRSKIMARLFTNSKNKYLADPFPFINKKGEMEILTEEFNFKTQKGNISVLQVENGVITYKKSALETSGHLSYPNVFKFNDRIFVVLESGSQNELNLFEYTDDSELVKVKTLIPSVKAIDPSIFFDGKYFWLSYTNGNDLQNGNLYLYYTEDLFTGWKPHKMNPVKYGKSNSRGAGSWFTHGGEIYRPAQNCKLGYGGSIIINKIKYLTPEIYNEMEIHELFPDQIIDENNSKAIFNGIHTMNFSRNNLIIDLKVTHFEFKKILILLSNRVMNLLKFSRIKTE
jgi:glycosyltransferase involved in cell wall biosynthesis